MGKWFWTSVSSSNLVFILKRKGRDLQITREKSEQKYQVWNHGDLIHRCGWQHGAHREFCALRGLKMLRGLRKGVNASLFRTLMLLFLWNWCVAQKSLRWEWGIGYKIGNTYQTWLCARHHPKCLVYFNSFNPHNHHMGQIFLLSSFYGWGPGSITSWLLAQDHTAGGGAGTETL